MSRRNEYKRGEVVGGMIFIKEASGIHYGDNATLRRAWFICRYCDCGVLSIINSVKASAIKSCGCLMRRSGEKAAAFKHGLKKHKLYRTWCDMKRRCYDVNRESHSRYGGRGIGVYNKWRSDFKSFYDYVIQLPNYEEEKIGGKGGLSLDRINNDGNYEPGNLRWATQHIQSSNRRPNMKSQSGLTGIHIEIKTGKWRSRINVGSVVYYLGLFNTQQEAAEARDLFIIYWCLYEYPLQSDRFLHRCQYGLV